MTRTELPTITEYFNSMIWPRMPHLGYFNDDAVSPGKVICPFHEDVNASLGIVPGTQIFNCFGCGAKGNVVGLHIRTVKLFVNKTLTPEEALAELCEAYEVTYTPPKPADRVKALMSAASDPSKLSLRRFRDSLYSCKSSLDWSRVLIDAMEKSS